VRTLHFSGYEWEVRQIASDRGGTPHAYSPDNAWTDAEGHLHLRVTRAESRWICAEVKLTRSLGYGTYAFTVRDASHLEPAVVLSMLTWDDGAGEENHREVDIELTQWGNPDSQNAQYVVQPYYVPANVARFLAPPGLLTHAFRWEPGRLTARTVRGRDANINVTTTSTAGVGTSKSTSTNGTARPIGEHVFTSGVPTPGAETLRINLYIFGSALTPLKNETEVVIEKFQYLP
jgi:hypothetical protein